MVPPERVPCSRPSFRPVLYPQDPELTSGLVLREALAAPCRVPQVNKKFGQLLIARLGQIGPAAKKPFLEALWKHEAVVRAGILSTLTSAYKKPPAARRPARPGNQTPRSPGGCWKFTSISPLCGLFSDLFFRF